MFKAEVIDRYMHCILQIFKKKCTEQFVGFGLRRVSYRYVRSYTHLLWMYCTNIVYCWMYMYTMIGKVFTDAIRVIVIMAIFLKLLVIWYSNRNRNRDSVAGVGDFQHATWTLLSYALYDFVSHLFLVITEFSTFADLLRIQYHWVLGGLVHMQFYAYVFT